MVQKAKARFVIHVIDTYTFKKKRLHHRAKILCLFLIYSIIFHCLFVVNVKKEKNFFVLNESRYLKFSSNDRSPYQVVDEFLLTMDVPTVLIFFRTIYINSYRSVKVGDYEIDFVLSLCTHDQVRTTFHLLNSDVRLLFIRIAARLICSRRASFIFLFVLLLCVCSIRSPYDNYQAACCPHLLIILD